MKSKKKSWAKRAWVAGWPVIFIGAFVASTIVHDPAKEEDLSFAGTSAAEDVLFAVGVLGVLIWIVGCFILLVAEMHE